MTLAYILNVHKSSKRAPWIRTGVGKGLSDHQRGIYPRKTQAGPLRLERLHWSETHVLDKSRGVTLEKEETQAYAEREYEAQNPLYKRAGIQSKEYWLKTSLQEWTPLGKLSE